jgi:hypothetical protein
MHRITKFRPSAAIILACLALFMALGGVGYAATKIHGKTIIDRTIPGKKLKKNAVGGTAIKESALAKVPSAASADVAQQATSAQDALNAQNAVNAQQATNADNAVNAQIAAAVGPDGVGPAALQSNSVSGPKIGSVVIRTDAIGVSTGGSEFETVGCESGEQLLSGGAYWSGNTDADAADLHIVFSYPTSTSWTARGYNNTAGDRTLTVRALCLAN